MIIVAVDPGETTGYVIGHIDDANVGVSGLAGLPTILHAGTITKLIDLTHLVYYEPRPRVIVIEDFRLLKAKALVQSGSRFPTVKHIGAVEFLVELRNHSRPDGAEPIEVVLQGADKQQFWSRSRIEGFGYNLRGIVDAGQSRHIYSAMSHMLYFVWFKIQRGEWPPK